MELLDSHVHLPTGEIPDPKFCGYSDLGKAVERARRGGVTGMVFTLWSGLNCESAEELDAANAQALALYESDPSFFYPGAMIDAKLPELSARWLREYRSRGLRWVGEVLPKGCDDYSSPAWSPLFDLCEEGGQIVQLHMSSSVLKLAAMRPGLKIVHSHIDVQTLPALAELPNVSVDFSGFGGLRLGYVEAALKALGPERLLFGSDFTVYPPEFFLKRLEEAAFDVEAIEKICSGNLLKLLVSAGGAKAFERR